MAYNRRVFAAMAALGFGLAVEQYDKMFAGPEEVEALTIKKKPRKLSEKEKSLYRETKTLREFKVKGNTVLAYSKKDAIKRLKHRSK